MNFMRKLLYQELASRIGARKNCEKSNNIEWFEKHGDMAEKLAKDFMPSGSGIDSGTNIDLDESTAEKLVFYFGYHHMDENGMYSGWTEHKLIVTPSLQFGISLRITGRDRNHVKEYLYEVFQTDLEQVIEHDGKKYFSPSFREAQAEYQKRIKSGVTDIKSRHLMVETNSPTQQ
jgi:hypothetical protein